eukprot:scaffold68464_cov13-Tisochrysis_lutea.AAC.1
MAYKWWNLALTRLDVTRESRARSNKSSEMQECSRQTSRQIRCLKYAAPLELQAEGVLLVQLLIQLSVGSSSCSINSNTHWFTLQMQAWKLGGVELAQGQEICCIRCADCNVSGLSFHPPNPTCRSLGTSMNLAVDG